VQRDFHHAATYAIARCAGFEPRDAATVAYASQYVDDAIHAGAVKFSNGAMYQRISSAHRMLDYRNFEALEDHLAWVPFHFLPGNGGRPRGQDPEGSFIRKLVCLPDSPVAHDMIAAVIRHKDDRHALHRLGITMHTYADTWAHQGFAGVRHQINHATHITDHNGVHDHPFMEKVKNFFVDIVLPLGHGTVLGHPDRPYLKWGYTNGLGEKIERDNPRDFLEASDKMCQAMQRFLAGDIAYPAKGLNGDDKAVFSRLFNTVRDEDPAHRHAAWTAEIAKGSFTFGPETIAYVGEGEGSWQHAALGVLEPPHGGYSYRADFLQSDWKLFHDALQAHRLAIVSKILPEYGICVA
jgi:hypothetical protein